MAELSRAAQALKNAVVYETAPLSERREQLANAVVVLRTLAELASRLDIDGDPFDAGYLRHIANELESQ